MQTLLHVALDIFMWLNMIVYVIGGAGVVAWGIVYYGCKCRNNPIGKAAILAIAFIWLGCSAIINLI